MCIDRDYAKAEGFEQKELNTPRLFVLDSDSHHPHWDRYTKTKLREEDFELYDLTVSRGLLLLTPPDVPTHTSGNVIDLGFCSAVIYMAVDAIVYPDFCVSSDHLPIRYTMDFSVKRSSSAKFNTSKMDLDTFNACLTAKLGARPVPIISSLEELNDAAELVNTVLRKALETSTPRRRPSSIAKRWWSDSLTHLCKAMRKTQRYYQRVRVPTAREAWLTSFHDFYRVISQAKLEVWNTFIRDLERIDIHKALNRLKERCSTDRGLVLGRTWFSEHAVDLSSTLLPDVTLDLRTNPTGSADRQDHLSAPVNSSEAPDCPADLTSHTPHILNMLTMDAVTSTLRPLTPDVTLDSCANPTGSSTQGMQGGVRPLDRLPPSVDRQDYLPAPAPTSDAPSCNTDPIILASTIDITSE
ncbi:hypothetical protein K438DRAFT_1965292 [Mycena galopus ATCC 62051]|nr:hypothetical protein K438DRAFT_1965292 [Mycena galopus ATCC 62051]